MRHGTTLDVQQLRLLRGASDDDAPRAAAREPGYSRYVKLIEKGKIDARSMITRRYTLEQGRQAVQDTADRTIIMGVIEFS